MRAANKPVKRAPRTLTCTLAYSADGAQLSWSPIEPTTADPCHPKDTIAFESPDVRSVLTFGTDSPFEAAKGAKTYEVSKGGTLTKVVDHRFDVVKVVQQLKFICAPDGVVLAGRGGSVPVGGGGL